MNIFRKKLFSFYIICKNRIKLCFNNNHVQYSFKLQGKVNYLIKTGVFSLVCNYLRPSNNSRLDFEHKCCCFDSSNLLRFTKMVKCLPEFEYFLLYS